MANVLSDEKQQQVLALGRFGWSLRWIQKATGVHRETASIYLKIAGIPVRPPGGLGRQPALPDLVGSTPEAAGVPSTDAGRGAEPGRPKPANEVTTDFGAGKVAFPASVALLPPEPASAASPRSGPQKPANEVTTDPAP
jgi:hypothetical protein